MRSLLFAHTATTVTRARLCDDHVLLQVVKGTLNPGEVIAEICVDYTTLGVITALAERQQPTMDPVLAKLMLVQETVEQMEGHC